MGKSLRKISLSILAACCLLTLGACQSKEQQQQSLAHKRIKRGSTLPDDQYFADSSRNAQIAKQQKSGLKQVAKQMSKNYQKIGNVHYNQKKDTITLNLTGSQMTTLIQAAQQKNQQAIKFWNELTKGMNKTSINISKQIKDSKLKFNIMSPENKQVYSVSNGTVNTNAFK